MNEPILSVPASAQFRTKGGNGQAPPCWKGWDASLQRWSFRQIVRKPRANEEVFPPQRHPTENLTALGGMWPLDLMGRGKNRTHFSVVVLGLPLAGGR